MPICKLCCVTICCMTYGSLSPSFSGNQIPSYCRPRLIAFTPSQVGLNWSHLQADSLETHQVPTDCYTGSNAACLSTQPFQGGIQQHSTPAFPSKETESAVPEHHPLQLVPGLSGGEPTSSQDRKQDLQHHLPEHRSPLGCMLSPPLEVYTSKS